MTSHRDRWVHREMPLLRQTTETFSMLRQARAIMQTPIPTGATRIVTLPMFIKDSNIRLRWSEPYAFTTDRLKHDVEWSFDDRFFGAHSGTVSIRSSGDYELVEDGTATITSKRVRTISDFHKAAMQLDEQSNARLVQLLLGLEPFAIHRARQISASLGAGCVREVKFSTYTESPQVLDMLSLEIVVQRLLFGTEGELASPTIRRIEKYVFDSSNRVGDPRAYLAKNIYRDLWDAIRVEIGDPRPGRVIRSAYQQLAAEDGQAPSIEDLIAELAVSNPRTHIGESRVRRALELEPLPMVVPLSALDEELVA